VAKVKTVFFCSECGHEAIKWLGCCPGCNTWNSFLEKTISKEIGGFAVTQGVKKDRVPVLLHEIVTTEKQRMQSGIEEWDRVVGGGVLPGAFIVVTGDPGVGKSTLLLQVAQGLALTYRVFYFSSEESLTQVKQRADRLGVSAENLYFSDESGLEKIVEYIENQKPDLVILDSIQNCFLSSQPSAFPGNRCTTA
jgi:DNA repair protein RadA/Sms